jgi:hypothetical protein
VSHQELIYDWNTIDPQLEPPNRRISFDDETLRADRPGNRNDFGVRRHDGDEVICVKVP